MLPGCIPVKASVVNSEVWRPDTACATRCGLLAVGMDCEYLQDYESEVLYTLRGFWDQQWMCRRLLGWWVTTLTCGVALFDDPSQPGQELYGLMDPFPHRITLHTTDFASSALSHELVHIFDDSSRSWCGTHVGWRERGLCKAIHATSSIKDGLPCDSSE